MEKQAPGRAQLERDVADVVGTNYVHQARVWVAIGMLQQAYGLEERAALAYLSRRATQRELSLFELADLMMSRQELP
jgi:AmiR/NasT family two-component response regulator